MTRSAHACAAAAAAAVVMAAAAVTAAAVLTPWVFLAWPAVNAIAVVALLIESRRPGDPYEPDQPTTPIERTS